MVQTLTTGIYLLKLNNRSTRTRCEICSKLTIKTQERSKWRRSGVFIGNFEPISQLVLVFLLLTLNMKLQTGCHHFILSWLDILPYESIIPAIIYLFKVNNRKHYKKVWNIFKVNNKTPERSHLRRWGVSINFEHISHLFLVLQLLTLNK